MTLFDFHHPFYRPLWRRIAVVAVCILWGGVEFATGGTLWAVLFIGVGLVAAWQFFFQDRPEGPPRKADKT
jgi:hypothetical protein